MVTPSPSCMLALERWSIIVIQNLGVYGRIEVVSLVQEATTMGGERLLLYRMRFSATTGGFLELDGRDKTGIPVTRDII